MKVLLNIAANSLKRRNFSQMVEKVVLRITEYRLNAERERVAAWCAERAEAWPAFAEAANPALWLETERVLLLLGLFFSEVLLE